MSGKEVELRMRISDGVIPDAAPHAHSPVKRGMERQFIEEMKQIFRKMDENPEVVQAAVQREWRNGTRRIRGRRRR
jgi:hypothetical protein